MTFNVDRWANYTRQNLSRGYKGNRVMSAWSLMGMMSDWHSCTPKQLRRMRKKFRKGDMSIGMYV